MPHADKIFHMVEYFLLGILMIRAFDHSAKLVIGKPAFKVGLANLTVLAIIISISYGGLDERYQRSIAGRTCDIFDFIADCAGALIGISFI